MWRKLNKIIFSQIQDSSNGGMRKFFKSHELKNMWKQWEKFFPSTKRKVRKFLKRSSKLEKLSLENLWKSQNNVHEWRERRSWSLKRNYKRTVEKSRRNLLFFSKVTEFIALLMLFISFNFLTILWFVTHTYPGKEKTIWTTNHTTWWKTQFKLKVTEKCAREKKKY